MADPNGFDYWRRGSAFGAINGTQTGNAFDYYRRAQVLPDILAGGAPPITGTGAIAAPAAALAATGALVFSGTAIVAAAPAAIAASGTYTPLAITGTAALAAAAAAIAAVGSVPTKNIWEGSGSTAEPWPRYVDPAVGNQELAALLAISLRGQLGPVGSAAAMTLGAAIRQKRQRDAGE